MIISYAYGQSEIQRILLASSTLTKELSRLWHGHLISMDSWHQEEVQQIGESNFGILNYFRKSIL
jgi:uncharacterized protein YqgQ